MTQHHRDTHRPLGTEPGTLDDARLENPIEETREELAESREKHRAERTAERRADRRDEARAGGPVEEMRQEWSEHRAGERAEAGSKRAEEARERGGTGAATMAAAGTTAGAAAGAGRLLSEQDDARWRQRWEHIQRAFVDNPRESVSEADALVGEVIGQLRELFESERAGLEGTWSRGEEVSTETLRRALQRYRSFFSRLLEL